MIIPRDCSRGIDVSYQEKRLFCKTKFAKQLCVQWRPFIFNIEVQVWMSYLAKREKRLLCKNQTCKAVLHLMTAFHLQPCFQPIIHVPFLEYNTASCLSSTPTKLSGGLLYFSIKTNDNILSSSNPQLIATHTHIFVLRCSS